MKKKWMYLGALAMLLGVLSGCCMSHEWQEATCEAAKTCAKCEKTEGEALGHTWEAAVCESPETCAVCGETQGQPLGHTWQEATCEAAKTCSVCSTTEGEPLGHDIKILSFSEDGYQGICNLCQTEQAQPVSDWEALASELLLGEWDTQFMAYSEQVFPIKEGSYVRLQFLEDGTVQYKQWNGEVADGSTGTWRFTGLESGDSGYWLEYQLALENVMDMRVRSSMAIYASNEPLAENVIDEGIFLVARMVLGYFCTKMA